MLAQRPTPTWIYILGTCADGGFDGGINTAHFTFPERWVHVRQIRVGGRRLMGHRKADERSGIDSGIDSLFRTTFPVALRFCFSLVIERRVHSQIIMN